MKIISLELQDFCQHEYFELANPARSTFLSGAIASGKTNTLNALRMVFLGSCVDQDGATVKPVDLIRDGAERAIVKVCCAAGQKQVDITLTIQNRSPQMVLSYDINQKPMKSGAADSVRDGLLAHLGVDARYIGPALNAREYFFDSLDARKRGRSLGSLIATLGGSVPTDQQYREVCGEHYETFARFLVEHKANLRNLNDVAALGKIAETERAKVGAAIEAREADLAAQTFEPPVNRAGKPLTPADTREVENAVKKLRAERDALIKQMGSASAGGRSAEEIARDLGDADRELAKQEAAHARLLAEEEKAAAAATDAQLANRDLIAKRQDVQAAINRLKGEQLRVDTELFEFRGGQCPKCATKLTKAKLDELSEKQQASKKRVLKEISEHQAALKQLTVDIEIGERTIAETRSALRQAQQALESARDKLAAARHHRNLIAGEKPAGDTSGVAALQTKADALADRIAAGDKILAALGVMQQREQATVLLEQHRARFDFLEWLYRECNGKQGAGALRGLFAGDGIAIFEERCNEVLAPFGSALRAVQNGSDLVLTIDGKPVSRASDGQMVLVETAVALAFADGGIVLIDRVCDLDGDTKDRFWRMLEANQERFETLICAGAWSPKGAPKFAAVAGLLHPTEMVWVGGEVEVAV